RGICRQELGEQALAVADFSTGLGLWPEFAWGHFNRGFVLAKAGHPEEALRDFSAAIERDPELVEAYLNRGLVHLERKEMDEALHDLDQARMLGRKDAFLHAGRGVALEGLGRFAEADAAFAEAFAHAETLPAAARARIGW